MPEAKRSRRGIVFLTGVAVIIVLDAVITAVLLYRHPEARPRATDQGDGLGLIIGFMFWTPLLCWSVCFWAYGQYASRRRRADSDNDGQGGDR